MRRGYDYSIKINMNLYVIVNLPLSHSQCLVPDEAWLSYDDKINMNLYIIYDIYKFSSVPLMLFNTRGGVVEQ